MSSPLEQLPASDAAASPPDPALSSPNPKTRLPVILAGLGLTSGLLLLLITGWQLWRGLPPPPLAGDVSQEALVIHITQDGFYRLTLADLRAAGLNLNQISHDILELQQQGRPVPIFIDRDSLIFYGLAPTSLYTNHRPYILRHQPTNQPPAASRQLPNTSQPPTAPSLISQTTRWEENRYYLGQARAHGPDENWFWETIQVGSKVEKTIILPQISASHPATLTLALWGSTYNDLVDLDHDLDVLLNGQPVGTLRWDGQIFYTGALTIPPALLQFGENYLLLDNSQPGAALIDIMHLNWFELTYLAAPVAVQDQLIGTPVSETIALEGFSGQPLLFDITEPLNPVQLLGWEMDSGRIPLTLPPDTHLAAIGPSGFLTPAVVRGLRLSDWANPTNQADLLIITTDALAPALRPLQEAREAQGIRTSIVPIAEIYDAFAHGEVGPDGLRSFFQYTHEQWSGPAPRYVLLVGDVSTDFRNYLGQSPQNIIPTYLIPVTFSGETVSDTRLADIDGDGVPDMALGRWPVDTPGAVTGLIQRTLAYEQGSANPVSIFAADGTEPQFALFADNLIQQNGLLEADVVKLYGQPAAALTSAWSEGAWLVTYNGHGSLDMWGKEQVLTSEAVRRMRPRTTPPIVLQFTCLTGLFAHPTTPSISEIMLTQANGPVLIIAATSLTLPNNQEPFAHHLLQALHNPANQRMGDALLEAQNALNTPQTPWLQEIVDTFGLLGDPSARLVRP